MAEWTARDGNVYDPAGDLRIATYLGGDTLQPDPILATRLAELLNMAESASVDLTKPAITPYTEALDEVQGGDTPFKWNRPLDRVDLDTTEEPTQDGTTESTGEWPKETTDIYLFTGQIVGMADGRVMVEVDDMEHLPDIGTRIKAVPHGH